LSFANLPTEWSQIRITAHSFRQLSFKSRDTKLTDDCEIAIWIQKSAMTDGCVSMKTIDVEICKETHHTQSVA
jgi:hypothetical protein